MVRAYSEPVPRCQLLHVSTQITSILTAIETALVVVEYRGRLTAQAKSIRISTSLACPDRRSELYLRFLNSSDACGSVGQRYGSLSLEKKVQNVDLLAIGAAGARAISAVRKAAIFCRGAMSMLEESK